MAEFLNSECPHCGQWVEYPAEGTGQTVPCPTCHERFVLKPAQRLEPVAIPQPPPTPPQPPAAPATPTAATPPSPAPLSQPPTPAPAPQPAPAKLSPPPVTTSAPATASASPVLPSPAQPAAPSTPATTTPTPPPAKAPAAPVPAPPASIARAPALPPLDQAFSDFVNDRAFEGRMPSREQVARSWAWAKFQKAEESETPNHAELVTALKKLFPQFKDPRPISRGTRPGK